ncbi:MAG: HAMP domain-containing protein [Gammaproteobacteria bacterium]|nr:HAMP domain-containing protein [Gammaproteobacteria bacterium]
MNDKVVTDKFCPTQVKKRAGLFRKYTILISILVSTMLVVGSIVEMYFSYQDAKAALLRIQYEKATSAATVISRFIKEVETQIGWTMHAAFLPSNEAAPQRRIDFLRLLRQAPEITEVTYIDSSGKEQLMVSRITIDAVGSGKDHTGNPNFHVAKECGHYFSPVYFRQESEPYLSLGIRDQNRKKGVTVAEVNLKFVRDEISKIDVGLAGHAFVVDERGLLVTHPDLSLVLRKTDLSTRPQVVTARAEVISGEKAELGFVTEGLNGQSVLSSHATVDRLGWLVFVESPLNVAFAPLYRSLLRTVILLVIGIFLSVLAGLLLARRIVLPIQVLQQGAARIGSGTLKHQIDIKTGDELESLADEFNSMSSKLRESYDNIEKVSALKRYFSPHLAELIVSSGEENMTESHRREITVVFCDLRNFSAFSSLAEPEEAMRVLEQYFSVLGKQLLRFEATVDHYAGDGLMAFLNDPLPCPEHVQQAVRMATGMQDEVGKLLVGWQKRDLNLGFGIGIATGYATIGHIGAEGQFHYTAIGSVANLASRLCDEAAGGEILVTESVYEEVESMVKVVSVCELSLKGFPNPVPILRVIGLDQ